MAEEYTASLTKTGAGAESVAYGTPAVTYTWPGKIQSFEINQTNVTQMSRDQNLSRETSDVDVLQKKFAGSMTWRVQDFSFFLAAFGTLNTTGVGPYVHTFTTGDTVPSYSVYHEKKGRGALASLIEEASGCKTNVLKLSCAEGGYLVGENTIVAKDKQATTQEVFTSSNVKAFRFADITSVTVDGNAIKLTNYEYTRTNTLTDEQEGELIAEPCVQELVEALSLGFKFKGTSARAPFIAGTLVPVVITFTRGTETLVLTHQVVFKEHPEPTGVEGAIEVSSTADVKTTTVVGTNDTITTYTY